MSCRAKTQEELRAAGLASGALAQSAGHDDLVIIRRVDADGLVVVASVATGAEFPERMFAHQLRSVRP